MKSRILGVSVLIFTLMFFSLSVSAADVGLDGIGVDVPRDIKVGEDFDVDITLEDPDDTRTGLDVDVVIRFDDIVVYDDTVENIDLVENTPYEYITINSEDFDYKYRWARNFMGYECGDHTIEVEVSGDVSKESRDDDIEIEDDYVFDTVEITPEKPGLEDEIIIYVEDDDGDELEDAYVRITYLGDEEDSVWEKNDDSWEDETDNDGEVDVTLSDVFDDDAFGRYQIDVLEVDGGSGWFNYGDYCKKTIFLYIMHSLDILEVPSAPRVGEPVKVKVVDENGDPVVGAKIAISGGPQRYREVSTGSDGYATFELDAEDSYSLIASKKSYQDSDTKNIVVTSRREMSVTVTPKQKRVGETITIKVTSDTNPVEDAAVTITDPNGDKDDLSTSAEGEVEYTPSVAGRYQIAVEKATYVTVTASFDAFDSFIIDAPQSSRVNDEITIVVKDQNNKAVSDATVSVSGADISGKTNKDGVFTFLLSDPGKYTVAVGKSGYESKAVDITVSDLLVLQVTPLILDLGDEVDITVSDRAGNKEEATIQIIDPSGDKEVISKSVFSFIPQLAGTYNVTATKENFMADSSEFIVNPISLNLKVVHVGDKLVATVTRDDEPIEDITVKIVAPEGEEILLVSDEGGKAEFNLRSLNQTGNYTVMVSEQNYEALEASEEIKDIEGGGDIISTILLILLVLIIIVILAIVMLQRTGGEKKKEKKEFIGEKKGGSRLEKI